MFVGQQRAEAHIASARCSLREATMQYRVLFLDGSDNVVREVRADARSARIALFQRSVNRACPPHGVRMRVLDPYGRAAVSRSLGRELLA